MCFLASHMIEQARIWDEASNNVMYSIDDSSFPIQMMSMKAVLMGILSQEVGVNNTDSIPAEPFLDERPISLRWQRRLTDATATNITMHVV